MRSTLLCVFFALIVNKEGSRANPDTDFKPIPIPLDEWNYEKREARIGTLHETFKTDQPQTVAAVPAHYWEDALKHSVYLTLVRDKIDQLIAKSTVVSPNGKPDQHASKEVDDHDLWEKIKKAPFDRIKEIEYPLFGDVTIMAKGRLMEENGGFRFTEDERSAEKCSDDKCMEGVKAFWSVKRVRQRDIETSPGRYHYELTFSVNSQPPKKQKKPHENPVRTFTVRENTPDIIVGTPQEYSVHQRPQTPRPQRAIWFHRNIVPTAHHNQARYYHQGLDRIFSSFFSDDETHVDPPPRYKPNPYIAPMMPQFSKVGYVGGPSEQHHQKRLMPYPYKPGIYKYPRPPLAPPPHVQHHYVDMDAMVQNTYPGPYTDHRHISPSNIVKTTRPAVLPTPPAVMQNGISKNLTSELYNNKINVSENMTKEPDISTVYKPYPKPRPTSMKVSYFSEHVRPPVYNAPPGVFVTMDKKPFKPMPPLKLIHTPKPSRRPIDFRPSPQVLDVQFSDPESEKTIDSAFRPILIKFNDTDDMETESTSSSNQPNKPSRKQTGKKPPKKHENIKSQRVTTTAPDIITVHNDFEEDNDTMQWANVLSAFTKTTPMSSQKEKQKAYDSNTEPMTSDENITTRRTTTTTEVITKKTKATTTTTPSSKKRRTRPPHKFVKPDKVKKHKRITTTTKAPEKANGKKTADLTPQASSAVTGPTKSWHPKNSTTTTTAATTTSTTSTTQKPSTTSTQPATTTKSLPLSTTATVESAAKFTQLKSKNRFRQSTLMIKGTSVKHDRWNVTPGTDKKPANVPGGKSPPRRKGSNFQGYVSTSTSKYWESQEDSHRDLKYYSDFIPETSKRTEASNNVGTTPQPTQPTYDETADHYEINNESTSAYTRNHDEESDDDEDIEVKINKEDEEGSEDHSEYIFELTSTTPNEQTNEIIDEELQTVTEPPAPVITTLHSVPKNKTKCKKKKNQHLAPTKADADPTTTTTIATTTKSSSGLDIIDEILGNLYDDPTEKSTDVKPLKLDEEESENHEKYLQIDEDFEDFLDNLGERHRHSDEKGDIEYEDDEKEPVLDDEVSPFDNDDVNESSRNTSDKDYDDYHERSYSLLELMAME